MKQVYHHAELVQLDDLVTTVDGGGKQQIIMGSARNVIVRSYEIIYSKGTFSLVKDCL